MPRKTVSLSEDAYERLRAAKREGESFSDTVKRLTSEVAGDWRHALGKYSEQASGFEAAVEGSRETTSEGLARRQREVADLLDADERGEE